MTYVLKSGGEKRERHSFVITHPASFWPHTSVIQPGIARIITCSYKHVDPHVRHKLVDYRMGEFHIARGVWVNFISKNGHGTTSSGGVRVRADGAVPRGAAGARLPLKLGRDLGRGGLFNLIRALTK